MHALKAVLEANAVKSWFYFFFGTTKWWCKIQETLFFRHLAETAQKVYKIKENAQYRNEKWTFTVFI